MKLILVLSLEEAIFYIPDVARNHREQQHRIQELEQQIAWFKQQLFGAKSEIRALKELAPADQFWLGEEFMEHTETPPPKKKTVAAYERECRKNPVRPKPADSDLNFGPEVPVKTIEVEDPATAHIPADQRQLISETVTHRLAQRSSYIVLKYVTRTWKNIETGQMVTPPAPASVIPGSNVDVSFLAGLLVDKYMHHLPLYRQHERLLQADIILSRGNLTRLVHRCGQLLEPIYHAVLSSVLQSPVLGVDESPTPAGLERGKDGKKGKMHHGYFWVLYGSGEEVCYLFSPSRSGKILEATLSGYSGVLLTDGYEVYKSFAKGHFAILHATCWVHARRNFIKCEKIAPEQCELVLQAIQQLYVIERSAELGSEELRILRDTKSRKIVKTLFDFLDETIAESIFLPSNAFLQAAQYMLTRRKELEVFLDRPEVPLDTNHVERTIRPAVIGRKNWMFNFTEAGARYSAIAYTLIQSCIAVEINPTVYFTDILQRIDTHPARDVHLLTPRMWAKHFASNPLRSIATAPD